MSLPEPGGRLALTIVLDRPGGHSFVASVHGRRLPADGPALLRAAVRHPWPTMTVTARIRWQGIKLYLRGLRHRPAAATRSTQGSFLTPHRPQGRGFLAHS